MIYNEKNVPKMQLNFVAMFIIALLDGVAERDDLVRHNKKRKQLKEKGDVQVS